MLTDLLFLLPDRVARWLLRRLGISTDAMHEWAHNFCVCGEDHE